MKLSTLKEILTSLDEVVFVGQNGLSIPSHVHLTEVGRINKHFMDCGGKVRTERSISLQLWEGIDVWHRLAPDKFLKILELASQQLELHDDEIEVEYQAQTIGKFALDFQEGRFVLLDKNTACLAMDSCCIPILQEIKDTASSCCSPNSTCS